MAPEPPFERIAIVGLGVMGGSLAIASSDRGASVSGWSPDPVEREAALAAAAVVRAPEQWEDAVDGADLVVLAAPLDATCALLGPVGRASGGATLTDLASLKEPVERAAAEAELADRWVGSHPMVGSERSGFAAATGELYEDAHVWTTSGSDAIRTEAVEDFWRWVGATPVRTDAAGHDALMGTVSHLPQLTANALGLVLEAAGATRADLGPGGRDMTRLAASSPEMWAELLAHAPSTLADRLRDLSEELATMADRLAAGDVDEVAALMERTRRWSDS